MIKITLQIFTNNDTRLGVEYRYDDTESECEVEGATGKYYDAVIKNAIRRNLAEIGSANVLCGNDIDEEIIALKKRDGFIT